MKLLPKTVLLRSAAGAVLCAAAVAAPAGAAVQPLELRAVGDSYASGEGAKAGLTWENAACHRSYIAAAAQAAKRIGAQRTVNFRSYACSGATSAGVVGQLDQLRRDTAGTRVDLLTMSVGGNDLNFAQIVRGCIDIVGCEEHGRQLMQQGGVDTLADRIKSLLLNSVPDNVEHVLVTEYPDPTRGRDGYRCGSPQQPAFHGLEGISESEAAWASFEVIRRLNTILASAVNAANAARTQDDPVFTMVGGIVPRFYIHGYCAGTSLFVGNPRFIATPVDSFTSQGDVNGTMHPNDRGQQAIADALVEHESFLTQGINLDVGVAGVALAGYPATFTVTAKTGIGTPVVGATVRLDGTAIGTTNRDGRLTTTMTLMAAGTHWVTVDHDPYPARTVALSVLSRNYVVSSSPKPLPMNQLVSVSFTATGDGTPSQPVDGTFTIVSGNGTFRVRANSAPTQLTLTMRSTIEYVEVYPNKPPRKVIVPLCPEVTFTPDDPRYETRDVSWLVSCQT